MPDTPLVHWMPPRAGATHAVPDAMSAIYTADPANVTCPVCLEHVPAGS